MVGVTDVGLNFLKESGLRHRIEENWGKIGEIILHKVGGFVDEEEIEEMLEGINFKSERKISIKHLLQKKLSLNSDEFLLASGELTDAILSKEDIQDIKEKYKISLNELDGVIAAYSLMHGYKSLRKPYSWTSKDKSLNYIWGDMYEDVQISQIDLHPDFPQKRIDNIYPLFGELPEKRIPLHYDYWETLITIPFKYSQQTGLKFEELESLKGILNAEPRKPIYSDSDISFILSSFEKCDIIELPEKFEGKMLDLNKFPYATMSNNNVYFIPVIDNERNLWFYRSSDNENSENNILINDIGSYEPYIKISKEDIPHLFKGVVRAVKNHQTRTHPEHMAYLISEILRINA